MVGTILRRTGDEASDSMPNPFFTIGHSTRPIEEFVALLMVAGVKLVVDVRTVPRSRTNPQFNRDVLPASLSPHGVAYEHLPELGGLRGPQRDISAEINAFWENASFHNYADYAMSEEFHSGVEKLRAFGHDGALRRHVRGGRLVAMPSADHCGLPRRRGRGGLPYSRPRAHRTGPHDARGGSRAGRRADLSGRSAGRVHREPMNRPRHESLRPLVDALRALLETAGPRAQAFLDDWPRELIARPVVQAPASSRRRPAGPVAPCRAGCAPAGRGGRGAGSRPQLAADLRQSRFRRRIP